MAVAHLQGKQTGRPRGSRSSPPAIRGLLWASRNLGKNVEPPSDDAKFWAAMAREQPEKFVAAVAALDLANKRPREEQKIGNTATQAGQRLRTIFLTESDLLRAFRRNRGDVPYDAAIAGCVITRVRGGVLFTVSSTTFRPLAEGEPVPALGATT